MERSEFFKFKRAMIECVNEMLKKRKLILIAQSLRLENRNDIEAN